MLYKAGIHPSDYSARLSQTAGVYAIRWATLMEERMAAGKSVSDVAQQASLDSDGPDIKGLGYFGTALPLLVEIWLYGDQLDRWDEKRFTK